MRGRKYTDKIDIWVETTQLDGYGGYTTTLQPVRSVWAGKETKSAGYKFQQYGLNLIQQPILFYIRGRQNQIDLNEKHIVKFKNKLFIIVKIENVDFDDIDIALFCESVPEAETARYFALMNAAGEVYAVDQNTLLGYEAKTGN